MIFSRRKEESAMSAELVLSTHRLSPNDTGVAWRDWVNTLFHGLEASLYGDTVFDGSIHAARAGNVVITKMEANRHRVVRTNRAARCSDAGYLKIIAPWAGCAVVEQHGRQAWVRPGAWAIYDTTGSYEVANPERSEHLIVMLPKERLLERGLRLDPLMGRTIGGASGISRVALETMRSTFQELPNMTPQAALGSGDLLLELVRLSLQELSGRSTAGTQLEAFKDRIRDHIGKHLRDPGLSIDGIAEALGCSKRNLHKAFADEEDTLAHYILRRRLQSCIRDLKDPMHADRTITDIAFSWGFSSSAYFSRVFREHTGLSASDFRQAANRRVAGRPGAAPRSIHGHAAPDGTPAAPAGSAP